MFGKFFSREARDYSGAKKKLVIGVVAGLPQMFLTEWVHPLRLEPPQGNIFTARTFSNPTMGSEADMARFMADMARLTTAEGKVMFRIGSPGNPKIKEATIVMLTLTDTAEFFPDEAVFAADFEEQVDGFTMKLGEVMKTEQFRGHRADQIITML